MYSCDNYVEQLLIAICTDTIMHVKSFSSAQAELTCVFAFSTNTRMFVVSREGGKGE